MYQNCCKKCGSLDLHTEEKGSNTGLYCSDCGAYQKWLSKDELRAFKHAKSVEKATVNQNTNKETYHDWEWIRNEIDGFVSFLNRQIDKELLRKPLSQEDALVKCAVAQAYEKDKNALINILNGRHWNEDYI